MLGESLLTLAALAGQMVVDAATSDGWEKAERGYAQLLGRGNAKQAKLVRRWLEETRDAAFPRGRGGYGDGPHGPGGAVGGAMGRPAGGRPGRRG